MVSRTDAPAYATWAHTSPLRPRRSGRRLGGGLTREDTRGATWNRTRHSATWTMGMCSTTRHRPGASRQGRRSMGAWTLRGMCGSGAKIGTIATTTLSARTRILPARRQAMTVWPGAGRTTTASRSGSGAPSATGVRSPGATILRLVSAARPSGRLGSTRHELRSAPPRRRGRGQHSHRRWQGLAYLQSVQYLKLWPIPSPVTLVRT
jgi:hypothetical protein